jgi:hypothetical protein
LTWQFESNILLYSTFSFSTALQYIIMYIIITYWNIYTDLHSTEYFTGTASGKRHNNFVPACTSAPYDNSLFLFRVKPVDGTLDLVFSLRCAAVTAKSTVLGCNSAKIGTLIRVRMYLCSEISKNQQRLVLCYCWVLAWLTSLPWNWKRWVHPKTVLFRWNLPISQYTYEQSAKISDGNTKDCVERLVDR